MQQPEIGKNRKELFLDTHDIFGFRKKIAASPGTWSLVDQIWQLGKIKHFFNTFLIREKATTHFFLIKPKERSVSANIVKIASNS